MVLVVVMVAGYAMPANAAHTHGSEEPVVHFSQVDNDAVTAGLVPNGQTEVTDGSEYADTDMVRVSIVLSRSSTIEAGYSVMDIGSNQSAIKYRDSLKLDQANMIHQIERTTNTDLDVVWKLTLAANIISANVPYGQIGAIEKLPGVKAVVLENQYQHCETEEGTVAPNMATSGAQIGTGPVWEAGYTGAGMRIAVIDTGIDTNHQSVNADAFAYALAQLAKESGMSEADYLKSLDLLDAEEIASLADSLNVKIDPQQAYVNGKIAFAYNYRDFDYDITHDNDEEGDHGSHVAGIATANSWVYNKTTGSYEKALEHVFMQGVAPDAQLLAMKVFGKGGAPYDSDFFAAIEDAIVLGADAINLSLGSSIPGRGHHLNQQFQQIMDNLTKSGVVVSISAGNSGAWVDNAENGGYLYSTDIGMDTVGQPSAFTNSLSVASVENDGMVGYYFTVGEETIVYIEDLFNSMQSLTTLAGEREYVFIDGVGKEEDWQALADLLPGKIAICSRGETNFTEKARLATEAGAIAVMVYNNVSGIIYLDMTEFYGTQPVVSLTQKQGAIIRENSTPVYDAQGNLRCLTGTMNISDTTGKGVFNSEYYTLSDFSSWGVPGSLEMKPEIAAPGGNIYSLDGLDAAGESYAIKSGTSMAAPQMAGMSALVMQYIRENGLEAKTGMDIRHLTQSLLMSTAVPVLAGEDSYYSILQQGAGLANVHNAVTADSYITMAAGSSAGAADGKVKVELYDDPDRTGAYSAAFTVNNLQDAAKTVELNADFFIQAPISDGEHLYLDTATMLIGMDIVWYVNGVAVTPDDLTGMDFNGDGQVSAADGQALLDYVTGTSGALSNKAKADVDGDGDIDSHDAYVFLRELSGITAALPAGGSVDVKVEFSLTEEVKALLEEAYPNGTYIQGYLFADTGATSHSIPVLGFYGSWTDASMFDVGCWPTYETEEDTRLPYTGILRGNDFQVRYAEDPNYHYSLGGNPVITDDVYMPERTAMNSADFFHGVRFTPIRHADQSRILVINETTGEVLLEQNTGAVNMAYYPNEVYGWQNAAMILETQFSLKEASEGDVISVAFTLVPEYYVDDKGNVDWDALGDGATMDMKLTIDNTAPQLKGVSIDVLNNTMTITASDNQYIAAAGLYNKTGTRCLAAVGSKSDIEKGEVAEYTFSLDKVDGKKFLVQVHDYAMNTATYLIEMQIGESAGVPDMMAFDLVQRHWTTFTKDFVYDYKTGTPRLEYADHIFYAATIAEHYVFASTHEGDLYVMPEDDLSDTTFVVDLGVVLYDMAYNKADGNIYAVTEAGSLVVMDKLSGQLTKVAELPKHTNTLACSPEGVFYFNELGTGKVYSFTLDTIESPVLLMEDPYLTQKDPIYGDRNGTEGNMGMEYDPNRNMICWNSHLEVLSGSYITFAYYYEIDPATGKFTRYSDFWHEMSCLMIPDLTERNDSWAQPTDKVSAVSLNKSAVEIINGTSARVVANVQPWTVTDRNVIWTSADTSIATVDQNGVITGVAPGTTLVTATSKLDPTKKATCQVTVELLQVTISGTVMDADSNSLFYSWNMAEGTTFTPGKDLALSATSATYSTGKDVFYMMEADAALQMHKVDANGTILDSAENPNGVALWDMAYSEVYSTEAVDKVTSIYYSYLLSAKDPMALNAEGFDLGSLCSYLVGITTFGAEQVEDENGNVFDSEHLILLDNDGYVWDFWVYPRATGGYDALYSITKSDLNLEFPGYDNMEHMFTSLMAGEDGNLYLAAFNGQTSELFRLTYDEVEETYLAVKIGEMGKDVWPATITSVTVNGGSTGTAAAPAPRYTMSATEITSEQLAAAPTRSSFSVTEAERNQKLGLTTYADEIVVNGSGKTKTDPIVINDLLDDTQNEMDFVFEQAITNQTTTYYAYTAPSAGMLSFTIGGTYNDTEWNKWYAMFYPNGANSTATTLTDTQPAKLEVEAGQTVIIGIRLYDSSKWSAVAGTIRFTVKLTGAGETPCDHANVGAWQSDDTNHWKICADCGAEVSKAAHSYGEWTNGEKSCECGHKVTCDHADLGAWESDDTNHWKTCATCGMELSKAAHSHGEWTNGEKSCECGHKITCDHANVGQWQNDESNHWKVCATCGMEVSKGTHSYTDGECVCGHKTTCEHTELGAWQSDDTNHWKICGTCGAEVNKATHSYGEWSNGEKSCECGHKVTCDHADLGAWQSDDTNHWKICATCGMEVSKATHSYGEWTNGEKSCECGKKITCDHADLGQWESDDTNHWKTCGTCGAEVSKATHSYGEWTNGEKSCECGHKVTCDHADLGAWQSDDTNHWKICGICGMELNKATHSYTGGSCECGKADPDAPQPDENTLVLGDNALESGKVYTYTVASDVQRLELDFTGVTDSEGKTVYQYAYGKGTRLKIMVNGVHIPNLENTKITVSAGQTVTVEMVSVDEGSYTATLKLAKVDPAVQLSLGDNTVTKGTDYSYIADRDGTLYTTIKELWYDGTYCSEASLSSTVVFKINGVAVSQFKNSFEVKAGDEITVTIGLSFGSDPVSALLNLSYEGFYEHPAGSRGNPYILDFADLPTDTVEIPAGTDVWYKLTGFYSGYYMIISDPNAYVIVSGRKYDVTSAGLKIPAVGSLQIGNEGTEPASFHLVPGIEEGTAGNPKDLVEGSNSITLDASENYYYDFVAPQNGTATVTVSGSNWRFWISVLAANGSYLVEDEEHRETRGDEATVTVAMTTGQSIVLKLGTINSSWSSPGGTLTVDLHFEPDGTPGPEPECPHTNLGDWEYNDTHHWKTCECGEKVSEGTHSYSDGVCICGKTDPSADCEHSYSDWADGKKICSKCGDVIICQHPAKTVVDKKDATCDEDGYTGDTYCDECGMMTKAGSVIPATGHDYHQGVCVNCGEKDPDYRPTIYKEILCSELVHNGVLTVTWDPAKMTLVGMTVNADYYSLVEADGSITLGYVSISGIPAGEAVAVLYFTVLDPEDADVTVTYKQVNNNEPGECIHATAGAPVTENKVAADCTHDGSYDTVTYCASCGCELSRVTTVVPAAGHAYKDGKCTVCGAADPDYVAPAEDEVIRLAGSHRWETAIKVADEMKANLDVEKFDAIIIASGNDFADALAGSYLSTVKNAPILLGWGNGGKYEYLDTDNIEYIKANLAEGGTVYILGGEKAVPKLYEDALKGYNVKRLGGANRFETNLLILAEAGVQDGSEILVCTSTNFADSLSASATAKPILLVFNEYGKLYGKQPEFLAGLKNCTFTVIGGESAVSADLAKAIETYGKVERLAGANRFETSVMVAQKYFEDVDTAVLAYAWNYPDGLCGGSLAYSLKAPLILTMTKYEAKAVEYAKAAGITSGLVLGGDTLISDEAVRAIFAMDAADEIIKK